MRTIVVAGIVAALCGGSAAVAGTMITSQDIQNGTIKPADLNKKLLKKINLKNSTVSAAIPGQNGSNGTNGSNGKAGATGAAGADADQIQVVTAGDLKGLALAPAGDNGDPTDNGTLTFSAPPAAGPVGANALEMKTTTGKTVVAFLPFPGSATASPVDNPLLSELTSATYSSLIHTQPQVNLDVAWKMEVLGANACPASNTPCAVGGGSASGYTTVVYEPIYNGGSQTLNEWHRHGVREGKIWVSRLIPGSPKCTQGSPCSLSEFTDLSPNATVQTVKLVIGQNSGAAWPTFDGFVDDLHVGFNGSVNGYDLGG